MTTTPLIRAVYENGHLRPLDPLNLREGEHVNLRVEAETELTHEEKLRLALGDLVRWPDPSADVDDDIDEEALMREVAEAFRGQPPLSETIIQERKDSRIEIEPEMAQIREALADMNIQWADPTNDLHAWVEEEAEAIDLALQGDPPLSQIIFEDRGLPK